MLPVAPSRKSSGTHLRQRRWTTDSPFLLDCRYGQLKLRAQRFGLRLVTKAKLKPGDTVLVALHSSIDFAVCVMAAQFAGLRVALANPDYAPKELKHVYKLVRPKKVIVHSTHPQPQRAPTCRLQRDPHQHQARSRWRAVHRRAACAPEAEARAAKPYVPEDLTTLPPTFLHHRHDGTPQGRADLASQPGRHARMNFNTPGFIPESLGGEQLRMLSFLPFFHAYGLVGQLHLILRQRGQLFIICDRSRPSRCVPRCSSTASICSTACRRR